MRPQTRTGTPTQQELIDRVEQPRRPADAAPWNPPTAGTHNWLLLHLPLSVAMTALMVLHAVRALKFW